MRLAYLHCATGISGDMTLAALIDAGVDEDRIRSAVGSLNLYYSGAHHWQEAEINALASFNVVIEHIVGTAVLAQRHERLVAQLQHALENRVVIERAIGVVMARDQVGAVEAFNSLRSLARSSRRRVSGSDRNAAARRTTATG